MQYTNRYQYIHNIHTNTSKGFFLVKFIIILAAIFGVLSFYGYTPKVLHKDFVKPYIDKFDDAKNKAEEFKTDSAKRDAKYQEYIDEI